MPVKIPAMTGMARMTPPNLPKAILATAPWSSCDSGEQIGIGNDDRDSDQNQRVEKRAADDGIDHQAAGFFGREVEFFSGLGIVSKPTNSHG